MPDVRSAVHLHKEDLELYVRGRARERSDRSILKVLSDLRQERELIGEAIIALEGIAGGHGRRRSRTFPVLDDNLEAQSPKDVAVRQAERKPPASSLR